MILSTNNGTITITMKILKILFAFIVTIIGIAIVPILMGLFHGLLKIVLEYLKLDAVSALTILFGLYVVQDLIKEFFKYTRGVINEKK